MVAVRATDVGQRIFLIAVTGYGQAEDRAKALAAGFDERLVKPVDMGRFLELLITRPSYNVARRAMALGPEYPMPRF